MSSMGRLIFKTDDYKEYLRQRLKNKDPAPLTQSALAKAAGCKASYISQCLNGPVHLLPEQLYAIGQYLKLNNEELEYALLLLQFARSGTLSHRDFLKKQILTKQSEQNRLSKQLREKASTAPSDPSHLQAYYSNWYMIAIHMLCTLRGVRQPETIANRLGIMPRQAEDALTRLQKMKLIEFKEGEYKATTKHLNLSDQNYWIKQHHTNWRLQATLRQFPAPLTDLHYTAVYSLSREDAAAIREQLTDLLLQIRERVKPSNEECLVAFNMDWFHLES